MPSSFIRASSVGDGVLVVWERPDEYRAPEFDAGQAEAGSRSFGPLAKDLESVEAIDTAMRLGANHPMGPLQLADFIGLDTCLSVMQVLHEGLADSKYRPCPLLVKYVEAGWLGRKTQRGFYDYRGEKPVPTR